MNLNFQVIQYIDDPLAAEGRNIAVLGHDGKRAYFRALGMDGHEFHPSHFKAISPRTRASAWVYNEWMEWFRYLTLYEWSNPDDFHAVLESLNKGQKIMIGSVGVLDGGSDAKPEEAMDYLFRRLVKIPKIQPDLAFEDRIAEVFRHSELIYREGFDEDVEIELDPIKGGEPVRLEFSFYLPEPKPFGIRTLLFNGLSRRSLEKRVSAIVSTFAQAGEIGFLSRDRCVVLCDRAGARERDYVNRLSDVAQVIDLSDGNAAWTLNDIFRAR